MMLDEKPSYLGGEAVASFDTSYNEDYPPKMTDRIMPPTAQPDLVSVRPKLPRPASDDQALPYTYRAEVAPYTENYMIATHPLSYGQIASDLISPNAMNNSKSGFAIISGAVAGHYLEPTISKKLGVKGYGAISGALLANALQKSIQNPKDQRKVFLSSLLPAVPLAVAALRHVLCLLSL